jgi:hypothetical protein
MSFARALLDPPSEDATPLQSSTGAEFKLVKIYAARRNFPSKRLGLARDVIRGCVE